MTSENAAEERQVVCSSCLNVFPELQIHVIPHFNGDVGRYVTTYRCERCWLASLGETAARLARTEDPGEVESFCALLQSHGIFLLEFQRGDPIADIRNMLGQVVDLLRFGTIRLSIGPLAEPPDEETETFVSELDRYEQLGEAAYSAMYEAKPYLVKDFYDDARSCFSKAIEMTKRVGLEEEATRLTRRWDEIVSVYNRQFRGIE